MQSIAERDGFQILTCQVDKIPTASTCKKIDIKLRQQAHDYICIYMEKQGLHHQWVAPVNKVEKRDIVTIEYSRIDQAEFLYSKIDDLSFDFDERTTIMDVKQRIQGAFMVNSEKITKDFYAGFKKEHTQFVKFIHGINDDIADDKLNKEKQWYASVMLNRLMFCYFIQKKGFLDMDENYLRHKLDKVQKERGENAFFQSFYKGFLIHLFHEGLNSHQHDEAFRQKYGRIPYLNGGMFDFHDIEKMFQDIDIDDEAFLHLFDFFDRWRWHLDTRITASGKDINPDVLGYIFEQYINDRAQMGAYYTKEDITEYIGKNCILPFLFDAVKNTSSAKDFKSDGYLCQSLRESGDRYIYDAVKHGYSGDWLSLIPNEIAEGVDTTKPQLLERRSHWNERTPEPFCLPTEIWRETVERFQRCDELRSKIASGEIHEINDFITYNLDIRQFTYDLLQGSKDHLLVEHFYHAMQHVSILDPTCGSGAFLFAAMNILEPLYEVCISRMEEFHRQNNHLFVEELEEINKKYRSNIQYFIYKSIILRNLYGVDIMEEAVEIAKLRLFLKMVAVVEVNPRLDNLGLDPLPDIDFNIRCGNTLVGYATETELDNDLNYGDMFAKQEFKDKVELMMDVVARAYEQFKHLQLTSQEEASEYKESKTLLKEKLAELNKLLNKKLYQSTVTGGNVSFEDWLNSHQPFHWLAEYYQIMHGNGGFDVIIGNPPYVEYMKKDTKTGVSVYDIYKLKNYETISCGNLYAFVMERTRHISHDASFIGMIVPLSGHSTDRMSPLVSNFYKKFGLRLHLNLSADANPQKLFEGVKFRLCIFIVSNAYKGTYSTKYTRWYAEERNILFRRIRYNEDSRYTYNNIIGKIASPYAISAFDKMQKEHTFFYTENGKEKCLYHNAPVNWIRSHSFVPYFKSERDGEGITTQLKTITFEDSKSVKIASCILNSSLFFIWWITNSDCYHLNKPEIVSFKYTTNSEEDTHLCSLANKLSKDMIAKSQRRVYNYKTSGRVEYDEFYMKLSKPIIDEIDKLLAKHYGFTEEELDFIINYDIKYRMGDELNKEEE